MREVEALTGAGYEVDVICLAGAEPRRPAPEGVTLREIPLRRDRAGALRYAFDYVAFSVLAGFVVTAMHLRHRYQVVQVTTMPDLLVFAAAVPQLLGARLVLFVKEPTPELAQALGHPPAVVRALARVEQAAVRRADFVLTVTDQLRDRLVERGADRRKIDVVLNCPSTSDLLGSYPGHRNDPQLFTLICHGTIERRYGHETMLRAVAVARRQCPRLRLRVLGTGTEVEQLKRLSTHLGLDDVVRFLGWVSHATLLDELARADVGVVAQEASDYADLVHSIKMYDFLLLGKPTLVSRLAAVQAAVDERAVCYFDAGDEHSLAHAIVALAEDPERRHILAAGAARLGAALGWENQRARYLAAMN